MEFLELAKQRYSERSFSSTPIEEDKLYKILEAGRIAPTACNNQPQRFYVLKSKAALTKAAALTNVYNAPVTRRHGTAPTMALFPATWMPASLQAP